MAGESETITIRIEGRDDLSGPANRGAQALSGLQAAARKSGSALEGIRNSALGFAAAMGGMSLVGQAFNFAKDAMVGFNASMEQSRMAWTQMLGSADAAVLMLEQLKDFASRTPFELPQLQQAANLLMGMGYAAKDLIPTLTDVGNAVASVGGSAFQIEQVIRAMGQMRMAGRVNAQDMNQLTNAMIPGWKILADYMQKPVSEVRKLSEEGKISAQVFEEAFRKWARSPQIGKMMEEQSRTFNGALSTIKDNLRNTAATAFEPLFQKLSDLARAFAQTTSTGGLNQLAANISGTIRQIITLFEQLSPTVQQAIAVFAGLAAAGALVVPAIAMIAPVLSALLGPVGLVAAAAAGLYLAWQENFLGIRDVVEEVMPAVVDFVLNLVATLVAEVDAVLAVITDLWRQHGQNTVDAVSAAWTTIVETAQTLGSGLLQMIGGFLATLGAAWSDAWSGLLPTVEAVANAVIDLTAGFAKTVVRIVREGILSQFTGLAQRIDSALGPAAGAIYALNPALGGLVTSLKNVGGVADGAEGAIDSLAGHVKAGLGNSLAFGKETAGAFGRAIESGIADATSIATGALTAARASLDSADTDWDARIAARRRSVEEFVASIKAKLSPKGLSAWEQIQADMVTTAKNDAARAALERQADAANQTAGALGNLGKAAKQAAIGISDLIAGLVATNPAMVAVSGTIRGLEGQIRGVQAAIKANQAAQKAAQAEYDNIAKAVKNAEKVLDGLKQKLSELNDALAAQKERLSQLAATPLLGMRQFDLQIAAVERQLKRLQLVDLKIPGIEEVQEQFANLRRTITEGGTQYTVYGISEEEAKGKQEEMRAAELQKVMGAFPEMSQEMRDYLATLPMTEDGLQKILQTLQLTKDLQYDEQLRRIKEAAEGIPQEMSFGDIMSQIGETKDAIASLTDQIVAQEAAVAAQQAVVDGLNASLEAQAEKIAALKAEGDALNDTLAMYQDQLSAAKERQGALNQALELAYGWFLQDREKVAELGPAGEAAAAQVDVAMMALLSSVSASTQDMSADATRALGDITQAYKTEMGIAIGEAQKLTELANPPAGVADNAKAAWSGVGTAVATGYTEGLTAGIPTAQAAGTAIAVGTADAAKTALGAQSPSLVFRQMGVDSALGLMQGLGDMAETVTVTTIDWTEVNVVQPVRDTLGLPNGPAPGNRFYDAAVEAVDGLLKALADKTPQVISAGQTLGKQLSKAIGDGIRSVSLPLPRFKVEYEEQIGPNGLRFKVPKIITDYFIQALRDILPEIALAEGGVVTRPTRALVGEAGPEAVVPLERYDLSPAGGREIDYRRLGMAVAWALRERPVRNVNQTIVSYGGVDAGQSYLALKAAVGR